MFYSFLHACSKTLLLPGFQVSFLDRAFISFWTSFRHPAFATLSKTCACDEGDFFPRWLQMRWGLIRDGMTQMNIGNMRDMLFKSDEYTVRGEANSGQSAWQLLIFANKMDLWHSHGCPLLSCDGTNGRVQNMFHSAEIWYIYWYMGKMFSILFFQHNPWWHT